MTSSSFSHASPSSRKGQLSHDTRTRTIFAAAVFVGFVAAACSPSKPETAALSLDAEDPLASVLRNKDALDDIPFATVIEAATGKRILAFDQSNAADREILDAIDAAMGDVLSRLNAADSPTRGLPRINEASRHVEDFLHAALDSRDGFSCAIPPNAEGEAQRSGYPDLRLVHESSGRVTYLDPKLFEVSSIDSTLRTFYFEPSARTGKILEDARHLLIGIAHDGNDGDWKFLNWHSVDVSGLRVRLKAEFQASNRDLYRPELIISSGKN